MVTTNQISQSPCRKRLDIAGPRPAYRWLSSVAGVFRPCHVALTGALPFQIRGHPLITTWQSRSYCKVAIPRFPFQNRLAAIHVKDNSPIGRIQEAESVGVVPRGSLSRREIVWEPCHSRRGQRGDVVNLVPGRRWGPGLGGLGPACRSVVGNVVSIDVQVAIEGAGGGRLT
jgi:hypothetical protein